MRPIPRAVCERLRPIILVLAAFAAAPVNADVVTVCSSGCDSPTIQSAVNMASAGDTIRVATTGPHTEPDILVPISVTIEGIPGNGTVVQAAASPGELIGRVLAVTAGTVLLRDLTLRYGNVADHGAGIYNQGHLTLERVAVMLNQTVENRDGGGVYNVGTLVLRDSAVMFNQSGGHGGGISSGPGATLVAVASQLRGNASSGYGGNLFNEGTANLLGCTVDAGQASFGGGAYNSGSLTFSGYLFTSQAHRGGGVYQHEGSLEVSNALIAANDASLLGGGAFIAGGEAVFTDTTFFNNEATDGGAIYHSSPTSLHLRNSTLSDNSASDDGGAIYVAGSRSVSAASSTIAGNEADVDEDDDGAGGGLYLAPCSGSPCLLTRAYLRNTIVADNVDRSPAGGSHHHDCKGELSSEGYNLVEAAGTSVLSPCRVIGDLTGVLLGTDPVLDGLADNGGTPVVPGDVPPYTKALLSGSPAIDQGNPAGCTDADGAALPADQRGAARVGPCDLGAYEYGGVPAVGIFADDFETGSTVLWSGG